MEKIKKIRVETTNYTPTIKEGGKHKDSSEDNKFDSLFYELENSDKVNLETLGQATQLLSFKISNRFEPHNLPQSTMSYITNKLYNLKKDYINLNIDFMGTKENSLIESFHMEIIQSSQKRSLKEKEESPKVEVSTINNNDEDSTPPLRHSSFYSQIESIGALTLQVKNKLFPEDPSFQESMIFSSMVLINAEILSSMNAAKSKREIGGLTNAKITNEDEKQKLYNAHFECLFTLEQILINDNQFNKSLKIH